MGGYIDINKLHMIFGVHPVGVPKLWQGNDDRSETKVINPKIPGKKWWVFQQMMFDDGTLVALNSMSW